MNDHVPERASTIAPPQKPAESAFEDVYRRESRAVLATLIRLLRDFDLAEEGLHEAFRAALEAKGEVNICELAPVPAVILE